LKGAQPQWAQQSSGLYGHPGMPAMVSVAVDLCLKRVASILVAELGAASEGAVRYGGEEFLVVLPEMQLVDAIRIAERIHRSVEKATISNEGPGLFGVVTASFGAASARRTHGGGVDCRRRYRSLCGEAQWPKPNVAAACSAE